MSGRSALRCFIMLTASVVASADLQNVTVGGQIRVRARYWDNMYVEGGRETRIPDFFLPGRPIGPFGASSRYGYDGDGNHRAYVEQDTRLKVSADFTDHVNAVIELDDYEIWGQDFRSDYVTGVDSRANSSDDVEILQSYIETNETFGMPLRLRIGRQQIKLGSGWLVGESSSTLNFSFDGVRATYNGEGYAIDGWATKLAEGGVAEQDGDVDFYGLSASLTTIEGHEFLAYWLYLRDARSINDTNFAAPIEWLEEVFNLDDYDPVNLHTVGLRATGAFASLDYAAEIAYQFGEADSAGALFTPTNEIYGDDDAKYGSWAGDVEAGYTFESVAWTPRVFIGGAYFGGEDNRDLDFLEWLNPFDRTDASISFNRLFSSPRYTEVFDEGRTGTNFYQIRAGVEAEPTDSISLEAQVAQLGVNETFEQPLSIEAGGFRIPIAPALAFLTKESGDDIGIATKLQITYQYSDDLMFRLAWEHLFADSGVDEGNFVFSNGLELLAGSDDEDAEYLEFETRVKF